MSHLHMSHTPARQRGVALFITLIMLVAMTIAALSLVQIVNSGNIIAGNLAFRQAAVQATDYGIEAAHAELKTRTDTQALANTAWGSVTCDASLTGKDGCQYFPVMVPTGADGAPAINWEASPNIINTAALPAGSALQSYQVRYFIDRLCDTLMSGGVATLDVNDMPQKCMAIFQIDEGANLADSGGIYSKPFNSKSAYYRVTVRAEGPRGTVTQVQSIMYQPS